MRQLVSVGLVERKRQEKEARERKKSEKANALDIKGERKSGP